MDNQRATAGAKANGRLERVNVMLSPNDRVWLEQITAEMRATGADISRSEVIRAGVFQGAQPNCAGIGTGKPDGDRAERHRYCRDAFCELHTNGRSAKVAKNRMG